MADGICSVVLPDGRPCPLPRHKRTWCSGHYQRWLRTGDPLPAPRPTVRPGHYICPKCHTEKPLSAFYKDRTASRGYSGWCKACVGTKNRANYAENREARQTHQARYRATHRDQKRELNRRWREDHPYKQDLERNRAAGRVKAAKRRAVQRDVWVEEVDPLVVLERYDGVCGICGHDVNPYRFAVDHIIPLGRGGEHSYENTQPAHPLCNSRKNDHWPEPTPIVSDHLRCVA